MASRRGSAAWMGNTRSRVFGPCETPCSSNRLGILDRVSTLNLRVPFSGLDALNPNRLKHFVETLEQYRGSCTTFDMPRGELDVSCTLVFALVLLRTTNRGTRSNFLLLSSAARSIEPFGAFARLRFLNFRISLAPLRNGFKCSCNRCCTVAVQR
jgi:hypothetical protein